MMRTVLAFACLVASAASASAALVITGAIDGPLSGGTPKAIELYATADIADLSGYSLDYYFNANNLPSITFNFSGSTTAGSYLYVTPNASEFQTFFGFAPTFTGGGSVNGDDSVVLLDGTTEIDTFGEPGTDGTGEPWEYRDGWAYRNNDTGPGAFSASEWTFSGTDELDGAATNATADTPFPIGTYQITVAVIPEPTAALFGSLLAGALGMTLSRRPADRD